MKLNAWTVPTIKNCDTHCNIAQTTNLLGTLGGEKDQQLDEDPDDNDEIHQQTIPEKSSPMISKRNEEILDKEEHILSGDNIESSVIDEDDIIDNDDDDIVDDDDSSSSKRHHQHLIPNLIFPIAKLCFIFEKMSKQPPSSQIVKHASKLLIANAPTIQREKSPTIQKLMNVILRKEILDEVINKEDVCQEYIKAIVTIAESPDYVLPVSFYHILVKEHDLESHRDYPGLRDVLSSFGLLPTLSSPTNDQIELSHRIQLNTMTFALLELWPESVVVGSALFKKMFHSSSTTTNNKQRIATTINMLLKCMVGENGSSGDVQSNAACRLIGNMLNVAENSTRKAIACEIYHLASYQAKFSTKSKSTTKVPDQIIMFLKQLTKLTYEKKDQRLDMIGLLACVLNDHLSATSTTVKRAAPAMGLVFRILPFEIAVGMAQETMISNTSSYVRVAVLNNLLQTWQAQTDLGIHPVTSNFQKKKVNIPSCLWDLLDIFLKGDPIEKIRLTCLDNIELLGRATTMVDRDPIILSLPNTTIVSVFWKCSDMSKKVQLRAMKLLQGVNDAIDCPSGAFGMDSNDEQDEVDQALLMADTLKASLSQDVFAQLSTVIFSLSIVMSRNPSPYHVEVKAFITKIADILEFPFASKLDTPRRHRDWSSSQQPLFRGKKPHSCGIGFGGDDVDDVESGSDGCEVSLSNQFSLSSL